MPSTAAITPASFASFGALLRHLRRRARLSQRELAIAVGYSESQISRLEQNQRLPDPATLTALFVPALELDDEPELVARMLELAAKARGEQLDDMGLAVEPAPRQSADLAGAIEAIPPPPAREVPRDHALAQLREQLLMERGLALCAMAGMGKTSLAAALARERARSAPVFWLTLTQGVTTSVDAIVRQLALFLVAHGQAQAAPLLQRADTHNRSLSLDQQIALIGASLARLTWNQVGDRGARYGGLPLLCFDNIHLALEDSAVVQVLRHLIAATPVAMLLTSREELPLPGIVSARLPGLERAEGLELIRLLGLDLEPALAERLFDKTGGSPMLLRLAAGQLRDGRASPAAAIAHLEKAPQVAAYLLETTLGRLQPAARRLVALVSVFRQPVNLYDELLAELCQPGESPGDAAPAYAAGESADFAAVLAELQRYQLIDHPAQAMLHPLVRDHVYATLATDRPHRRRLHRIAATWLEQTPGNSVETAYHYAHADELQPAVEALADRAEELLRGGQALAAAEVLDEVLARARRAPGAQADLLRRLLTFRGDLLMHTLRADTAEESFREALALTEEPAARARIVRRLAESLAQRGQAAEALELCQAAAAALAPDEASLLAQLATAESYAHLARSCYDEAALVASRALAAAGELGERLPRLAAETRARAHDVLGVVMRTRRRFDMAIEHAQRAIGAARQAGLIQLEHRCRVDLAAVLLARGDFDAALARAEETLPQLRALGDSYGVARLLLIVTLSRLRRGEFAAALEPIDQACALHRLLGDTAGLAAAENQRATVLITLGRVAEARTAIERVLATAEATGEQREYAYFQDTLCMVEMLEGNGAAALSMLRRLLGLPGAANDAKLRGDIQNDLALALLMTGGVDEAGQILAVPAPPDAGLSVELEYELLRGLYALAHGDWSSAGAIAGDVHARAAAAGLGWRQAAAARLAAAALRPPSPAAYPWILWAPSSPMPSFARPGI